MKLKIVGIVVVASLAIFAALAYFPVSRETGQRQAAPPQMIGVVINTHLSDVETLRNAARQAGWKRSRHDKPGYLVLLTPPHYKPENLTALINAVRKVKTKKISGHIIDANGHPQAADLLVDQNNAQTH